MTLASFLLTIYVSNFQDVKNKTILNDVDSASDDYLRKVRELNPGKRKEEMEKIQKMFKKAKEHGEYKVNSLFLTHHGTVLAVCHGFRLMKQVDYF